MPVVEGDFVDEVCNGVASMDVLSGDAAVDNCEVDDVSTLTGRYSSDFAFSAGSLEGNDIGNSVASTFITLEQLRWTFVSFPGMADDACVAISSDVETLVNG